ncbi:hypothetical protein C9439_00195 [archaeon SCG-AAA382B04]|nr:hypothetical protein C9439_00195 [archaeon SCG-AAA382B04]
MKHILRRGLAFLIDFLIISIVGAPIGVGLSVSTSFLRAGGYLLFGGPIILVTILLIGYFYHLIFWSSKGQTPGKMITKLRVIDKKRRKPESKSFLKTLLGLSRSYINTWNCVFLHSLSRGGKRYSRPLSKNKSDLQLNYFYFFMK